MREKRKLAFGYIMRNGKICPHPEESVVVKTVYIKYADGASYLQITAMLNAGTVSYHEPGKPWNKNMVARILCNEIYIGAKGYPRLIDDDLFQRVLERKPATGHTKDMDAKMIRALCKCACCGSKVMLQSNRRSWGRWNCPICGYLADDATLPSVTSNLEKLITELRQHIEVIRPASKECAGQNRVQELERSLQEALEQEQFDDTYARRIVMDLAQARLEAIGVEDHEAMRVQRLLTSSNIIGESNMELLPKITSAILIPVSGDVQLLLINGQAIGRSDFEWQ